MVFGEGSTDEEAEIDHDKNLRALLERCQHVNLKLNKEKVKLK